MKSILVMVATLFFIPSKPSIEHMFYEERMIGVVVREGVFHYQEDGKTVYYIPSNVLEKLPIQSPIK